MRRLIVPGVRGRGNGWSTAACKRRPGGSTTVGAPVLPVSRTVAVVAVALMVVATAWPGTAQAQATREFRVEIKGIGGYAVATEDEDPRSRGLAGAAVRVFVAERFAIEPELLYLVQSGDPADYLLSVALQFGHEDAYLVAAAGVLRRSARIGVGTGPIATEWKPSIAGGFGWHFHLWQEASPDGLSRALVLTPDVRFGYNPLFRATVAIGYEWY